MNSADEVKEPIVTVTRTLVYTGSASWVQMCLAHSFVRLQRELGKNKSITSEWGEIVDVPEVQP